MRLPRVSLIATSTGPSSLSRKRKEFRDSSLCRATLREVNRKTQMQMDVDNNRAFVAHAHCQEFARRAFWGDYPESKARVVNEHGGRWVWLPVLLHLLNKEQDRIRAKKRLREKRLWLVDDDAYYNGKYVTVSAAAANLPVKPMGVSVDSRDAVKYHLAEQAHRLKVMRALLAIGKATGREVILPRMLCYCDFMWKEMRNCRVGGAETMRLPFDCPMDHVSENV